MSSTACAWSRWVNPAASREAGRQKFSDIFFTYQDLWLILLVQALNLVLLLFFEWLPGVRVLKTLFILLADEADPLFRAGRPA